MLIAALNAAPVVEVKNNINGIQLQRDFVPIASAFDLRTKMFTAARKAYVKPFIDSVHLFQKKWEQTYHYKMKIRGSAQRYVDCFPPVSEIKILEGYHSFDEGYRLGKSSQCVSLINVVLNTYFKILRTYCAKQIKHHATMSSIIKSSLPEHDCVWLKNPLYDSNENARVRYPITFLGDTTLSDAIGDNLEGRTIEEYLMHLEEIIKYLMEQR